MLPSTVLCDARMLCSSKKIQHLTTRDFKLRYFQPNVVVTKMADAISCRHEMFVIYALHFKYISSIDVEDAVSNDCSKLLVYLIHTKRLPIQVFHSWKPEIFCGINDPVLYTIVKSYAQQGLKIREIFQDEGFLYHISRAHSSIKTTKLLFRLGLHINDFIPSSMCCLECKLARKYLLLNAVHHGSLRVVKILFEQQLTMEEFRCHANFALVVASRHGNLPMVTFLIQTVGLTLNDLRAQGNAAIRWASENGHAAVVDILTRFLTPKDLRADNNYAICKASENGHATVVAILTRFLTLEDLRTDNNFAIRKASENGHAAVVEILVRFLTPDDLQTDNNYALRWATEYGHSDVVEILARFQTSTNLRAQNNEAPTLCY